jgi:hypothetical protein
LSGRDCAQQSRQQQEDGVAGKAASLLCDQMATEVAQLLVLASPLLLAVTPQLGYTEA